MRVLGLIPARGGSKEIPQKNERMLGGRPVLQYTAQAALEAERLARVVLSTDSRTIADLGVQIGVEVPFMRPAELAQDETPMIPVVQHAIETLESAGDSFDAVCLLQPSNPFRSSEDIDGAVGLMEQTGASSVLSLVDVGDNHPARMKYVSAEGLVVNPPFAEESEGQLRQTLPKVYLREGSIYLARRDLVMEQNTLQGPDCRAWIVSAERALKLDTLLDWRIAESLLEIRS